MRERTQQHMLRLLGLLGFWEQLKHAAQPETIILIYGQQRVRMDQAPGLRRHHSQAFSQPSDGFDISACKSSGSNHWISPQAYRPVLQRHNLRSHARRCWPLSYYLGAPMTYANLFG